MFRRLFKPDAGLRTARTLTTHVDNGQTITIQRVRLFKARNVLRSLLIGGGVSFVCWHLYTSAVISPLLRHLEHEYASLSQKERIELAKKTAEEDPSVFIALPFTTRQIEAKPYKGTDPEWIRFGEISKDKGLQEKIRNDLADLVKSSVSKHPVLVQRCGKQMSLRRYWLDIDFPYRPPPTFEQSGLLIDEEGISWASEPVDSLTVQRLRKILWPTAMAQSSWAFTSAMVSQHWGEIKRSLGFESPSSTSPAAPSGQQTLARPNLPSTGHQTPDGTPTIGTVNAVSKTADQHQAEDPSSGGRTNFLKDIAMSHVDGARQMSTGPWMEFRRKLSQTWKSTKDYPPRGSIMVSGFVELETPKGFVVVDVRGFWDPEAKQFASRSMFMNVRRIQMKVQTPARR